MHTSPTDGQATADERARPVPSPGHDYIAITDHSRRLTMTRGPDPTRLREPWRPIEEWNPANRGFTILKRVDRATPERGQPDLHALRRGPGATGGVGGARHREHPPTGRVPSRTEARETLGSADLLH